MTFLLCFLAYRNFSCSLQPSIIDDCGSPVQIFTLKCVCYSEQGSNYKEGLTPVLSLLTEGSRCHREIRRYIKAKVP